MPYVFEAEMKKRISAVAMKRGGYSVRQENVKMYSIHGGYAKKEDWNHHLSSPTTSAKRVQKRKEREAFLSHYNTYGLMSKCCRGCFVDDYIRFFFCCCIQDSVRPALARTEVCTTTTTEGAVTAAVVVFPSSRVNWTILRQRSRQRRLPSPLAACYKTNRSTTFERQDLCTGESTDVLLALEYSTPTAHLSRSSRKSRPYFSLCSVTGFENKDGSDGCRSRQDNI